jgi:hypothetical protein
LTNLRNVVDIRKPLEANLIAFPQQVEQGRPCVQSHQERISLEKVHDFEKLFFSLDSSVRENDFALEAAILTTDLKFL